MAIVHPAFHPLIGELLRRPRKDGMEAPLVQVKFVRLDGGLVDVEGAALPTTFMGKPALHFIYFDISERKRLEGKEETAGETMAEWMKVLEAHNRRASLLDEMGDSLQSCFSLAEACHIVNQFVPQLFPDTPGALFMRHSSAQVVELAAVWGKPLLGQRSFRLEDCWALRSGRGHIGEDGRSELVCRHLSQPPDFGYFCLPLAALGETVGVLHLQTGTQLLDQPVLVRERQLEACHRLARSVSEHLALNLTNLKLRETNLRRSIRDPLTGLFNRHYLEESLERELFRAARNKESLGLILLDVDRLKEFNQTSGHEGGSAFLRTLGEFLRRRTSGGDIACRFGGDEFMLVLSSATLEETRQRAEKLCQEVKTLEFPDGMPVGISMGVAAFPGHGLTKEILLEAANSALLSAKSDGGDRVAVARGNDTGSRLISWPD